MFRVTVLATLSVYASGYATDSSRKGRSSSGRDDPFFFPAYAVPPFGSPTAAQAPFTYGGLITGAQCYSQCDATERYAIAEASRAVIAVETEIANSVLKTQTLEDNIVSLEAQLAQCFGAPNAYPATSGSYGAPSTGGPVYGPPATSGSYGAPSTGGPVNGPPATSGSYGAPSTGGPVYGASVDGDMVDSAGGYDNNYNNGDNRQYGFVPTYNTLPATYSPACSAILAQIGNAQNELCYLESYIISLTEKSAALTGVRQALAYQCVGGNGRDDYFNDYKKYGKKTQRRL